MSDIKTYEGKDISVSFEASRCIHTGRCLHGCPDVFDLEARPWIQPDKADEALLIETVEKCPSGALQYKKADGTKLEKSPPNSVRVRPNGPLFLRGDFTIVDGEETKKETRLSLCRCGHSKNKPFCDNAHKEAQFKDSGKVEPNPEKMAGLDCLGEATIELAKNGPLIIKGEFEVVSASGEVIFNGSKAGICRCGASKNKPFCDGTHKEIDFSTD